MRSRSIDKDINIILLTCQRLFLANWANPSASNSFVIPESTKTQVTPEEEQNKTALISIWHDV